MEDLYDNLENYHDENIIDELKNENQDLKLKLEEYSSAMARLQNDFDKLNSEYKKLEMNYSSLLKTARAEIERKSEMIKSLNSEKDLLIIKSLQKSSQNNKNPTRRNVPNDQRSNKSCETEMKHIGKPQPEPHQGNQNEGKHKNERIYPPHNQFENTTASVENKSNSSEDKYLKDNYYRNKTDKCINSTTKGTYKDEKVKETKTKGEKISNRRKSMPMSRLEPIFSSDDDFEALNMKNIRKSPIKDDTRQYERYSNKDNYYQSTKDRLYSSKSKKYSDYKYRHDKYDSSSKYTRHTPEIYHDKNTKDHSETYKSRSDYQNSRQRISSPPSPPKYSRSKSRDRRNFDREINYEKKRNTHISDNSAVKHKIRNELEEPISKRQKTEMVMKDLPEENICNNDKEKEFGLRSSYPKQQDYMESSCQSPDYVNIDNIVTQHIAKEIKHTAVAPQEDPRLVSKKYILNKEHVLSTLVSEHVDIKPINVTTWDIPNIKKFMIPHTSITRNSPVETDKQFVDEVYMDIDNPTLNDSLESGEIQSLHDYEIRSAKESNEINTNENNSINKHQNEKLHNTEDYDSNITKNSSSTKYKIPKIKKVDTGVKHGICELPLETSKFRYEENKEEGKINEHSKIQSIQPTPINVENITNDGLYKYNQVAQINAVTELPHISRGTLADDLELSDEESKDLQKDVKLSKIASMTEAKDNIPLGKEVFCESKEKRKLKDFKKVTESKDLQKDVKISKTDLITKDNHNIPLDDLHCASKEISKFMEFKKAIESKDSQKDVKLSKNVETKDNILLGKEEHRESKEKSKPIDLKKVTKDTRDCGKTRKSKKKIDQKQVSHTETKDQQTVPKTKDKLSKPAISVQTKNKFSDLFGDSCSLITPDDLGISPPDIQLPLISKYTPMFENTQDAVDMCVKDINKEHANASKTSDELINNKTVMQNAVENTQDAVDMCVQDINKAQSNTSKTPDELLNNKTVIQNAGDSEYTLVPKDEGKNATINNLALPSLTENVTTNGRSETVKAVIISSSIKPKYTSDTLQSNHKISGHAEIIDNDQSNMCTLKNIKALATSTPYKPELKGLSTPDPNVPNEDVRNTEKGNLSSTVNNSSNAEESSCQTDVPDVRIIVRRRRKIVKKS
ncbi:repetitive organellar protein isoform X2 [Bicyclus anynana]|uniref:Repetitive organellar protein isoform X2 n=1 Tax=Bicyclus anynana TaxID=110368 RepID=A0A6J1NA32_BICAN|nr:repetitive organellar protein isoform X2 [Bicyclus anynana]